MSRAFDRAFAGSIVDAAGSLHAERARERGKDYARPRELLRLRFEEGLAIRQIAALWSTPADTLHHQYAQARKDYHDCLRTVVGFHHEGASTERLDEECRRVLDLSG